MFDLSLLKKAYNTRRTAHANLKEDLDVIQDSFPKRKEIQRGIKFMRTSLSKISKDEENRIFWETTAIQLNDATRKRETLVANLTNTGIEAANAMAREEFNLIDDCPSAPDHRNKKQRTSHEETTPTQQSIDRKSIASIIKSEAEAIFDKVLNKIDIASHERMIMTNGLPSILDLSDGSKCSQRMFFTSDAWKRMVDLYHDKYRIVPVALPAALTSTWKIVCHKIEMTRSIDSGLKYFYQVYPKYYDNKDMFAPLKALETILSAMSDQHYLFEKQATIDVTEYDYLGNIWLPLFRVLFQKSTIRIKTHESTFAYTTQCKVDQYPESANVIGFKIDVRFLLDHDGQEYDLCSGEMAKMDDEDKVIKDRAKVNRESKDDLDCMLDFCDDGEWTDRMAWQFQSAGSTGHLNSIHLAGNGLYVVLGRYHLKLPSSIADISTLLPSINDLFTWRKEMYAASDFLRAKLTKKHNLRLQNVTSPSSSHRVLQRDTTYSPPEKTTKWRKPESLYGYVPTNVTEKLLAASHSSRPQSSSAYSSTPATYENLAYDANGWAWTGDKWYNKILGEHWDENPYGDDK